MRHLPPRTFVSLLRLSRIRTVMSIPCSGWLGTKSWRDSLKAFARTRNSFREMARSEAERICIDFPMATPPPPLRLPPPPNPPSPPPPSRPARRCLLCSS